MTYLKWINYATMGKIFADRISKLFYSTTLKNRYGSDIGSKFHWYSWPNAHAPRVTLKREGRLGVEVKSKSYSSLTVFVVLLALFWEVERGWPGEVEETGKKKLESSFFHIRCCSFFFGHVHLIIYNHEELIKSEVVEYCLQSAKCPS